MADGGGPTEQDRSEGMPSLSEAPNVRGKALWLLSRFSKVTRRQGGTISRRYRKNGYAPSPNPKTVLSKQHYSLGKVFIQNAKHEQPNAPQNP
jgi:hypothetical protein